MRFVLPDTSLVWNLHGVYWLALVELPVPHLRRLG